MDDITTKEMKFDKIELTSKGSDTFYAVMKDLKMKQNIKTSKKRMLNKVKALTRAAFLFGVVPKVEPQDEGADGLSDIISEAVSEADSTGTDKSQGLLGVSGKPGDSRRRSSTRRRSSAGSRSSTRRRSTKYRRRSTVKSRHRKKMIKRQLERQELYDKYLYNKNPWYEGLVLFEKYKKQFERKWKRQNGGSVNDMMQRRPFSSDSIKIHRRKRHVSRRLRRRPKSSPVTKSTHTELVKSPGPGTTVSTSAVGSTPRESLVKPSKKHTHRDSLSKPVAKSRSTPRDSLSKPVAKSRSTPRDSLSKHVAKSTPRDSLNKYIAKSTTRESLNKPVAKYSLRNPYKPVVDPWQGDSLSTPSSNSFLSGTPAVKSSPQLLISKSLKRKRPSSSPIPKKHRISKAHRRTLRQFNLSVENIAETSS